MKKNRFIVFLLISIIFLSCNQKINWDIDVTQMELDYLDFDSIDVMNKQLEDVQKNKDLLKGKEVFTTLWDTNHTENYLNTTKFIEAAISHDMSIYYLASTNISIPEEYQMDYKDFLYTNCILNNLEKEYKKIYKTRIDLVAVEDYKKALNLLRELGLFNIVYYSELGSKQSYDIAYKTGEWIADFYKDTKKLPFQNKEIITTIIKEKGFDSSIPYLNETVAFSNYLTVYYMISLKEKVEAVYDLHRPAYTFCSLEERNSILPQEPKKIISDEIVANTNKKIDYDKNGNYKFSQNNLYGVKNKTGKTIIPCEYKIIFLTEKNNYCVTDKNSKLGYFNKNGILIFPCLYNWVSEDTDENGNYTAVDNDNYYICKPDGRIIISSSNFIVWIEGDNSYYATAEMAKYSKNGVYKGSTSINNNSFQITPDYSFDNPSYNYSSNNSNKKTGPVEVYETCPTCKGLKKNPYDYVSASKYEGVDNTIYCEICGRYVSSHVHRTCNICKGTGKVKRIKWN